MGIEEILNNITTSESNLTNTSFIQQMQNIAGNPSDAIDSKDDPDSIYGSMWILYNEMVAARSSDAEITAALLKIENLSASATSVASTESASATLVGSDIQIQVPVGTDGEDGVTPTIELTEAGGILKYQVTGHTTTPEIGTVTDIANLETIVDGVVATNVNVVAVDDAITEFTDVTVPAKVVEIQGVTDTEKAAITAHAVVKTGEYDANHTAKLAEVQVVVDQVDTSVAEAAQSAVDANASAVSASGYNDAAQAAAIETAADVIETSADQIEVAANTRLVEEWHADVMEADATVESLLRRADTYADLPAIGVPGTTYVVLNDETSEGNTVAYTWVYSLQDYVEYRGGAEFTNVYKDKLDLIEDGATADQTGAEIKVLYEAEANTNVFTDADQTKLGTLTVSLHLGYYPTLVALQTAHPTALEGNYADVDTGVAAEVERYLWDATDTVWVRQLGTSSLLTDAQVKAQYEANVDTNVFDDAAQTKLGTVETGATADQTATEIETAYEGIADTNKYTDAEKSKLGVIEVGATADQTALEIKTAYESNANTNEYDDTEQGKVANTPSDTITELAGKQETLVNQTNIKSINGDTLLGAGDLVVSAGSGGYAANVYLTNTPATTVGTYSQLSYTPEAAESLLFATANNGSVLIEDYIFDGDVLTTVMPAGEWGFHFHRAVANTAGDTTIRFDVYARAAGGVETTLFSAESKTIEDTAAELETILTIQPSYIINETDRIGVKVYATTTRTSNTLVELVVGDGKAAYFTTPLEIRHSQLRARDDVDSHPIVAITGLQAILTDIGTLAEFEAEIV